MKLLNSMSRRDKFGTYLRQLRLYLRSTCPQCSLLGQSSRRRRSTYRKDTGCKRRRPELTLWPSRNLESTKFAWGSPAHSICPFRKPSTGRHDSLQLYCDRFPQGKASILKFLMHCSMTRQGRRDSRRPQWLPARFCTCQDRMPWLRKHPLRTTTRAGTPSTLSGQTHWSQGCRYPLDTESPTQPDNTCLPSRPCSSRRLRH